VATVPLGTPAYQALMTLNKLGRSALGLVDGEGRLCGNFSLSDLRGIQTSSLFTQLPLAVEQFIMINAMAKMGVDGFRCDPRLLFRL
jgi:CBS domain-containing protein